MAKRTNPIQQMIDKSIKELKTNSKMVEKALETFLESEGIEVSEKEFREIQQLTNTMNELDKVLLEVSTSKPKKSPKKKGVKKRRKK